MPLGTLAQKYRMMLQVFRCPSRDAALGFSYSLLTAFTILESRNVNQTGPRTIKDIILEEDGEKTWDNEVICTVDVLKKKKINHSCSFNLIFFV